MRLLPLLLLVGCWLPESALQDKIDAWDTGTVDTGPDVDTDQPITVLSVDPPFGSTAGGNEVVIEATEAGSDTVITFDGEEASLISRNGSTFVVTTPEGTAGLATVEVTSFGRTGSLADAYRYYADQTGNFLTIGSIAWFDYVGDLEIFETDEGYAYTHVMEPQPYGFDAVYGASMDSCALTYGYPGTITAVDVGQDVLTLEDGNTTFELDWNVADGLYDRDLDVESDYPAGRTFDLVSPGEKAPWHPFTIEEFVSLPESFSVTAPNLTSGTATVDRFVHVTWDATDAADYVVLRLFRWDDNGDIADRMRCLVRDDGDFVVPDLWTGWNWTMSMDIYVGRVDASEATFPHNNASVGTAAVYWVAGTAYQGLDL